MGYWKELLTNWRPLLGATLALAFGFSASQYVTSIMAPRMIEEFGWSRAEFAAVGSLSFFTTFMIPIAGRLTDVFGVRRTALVGFGSMPIFFVLLSMQEGDLRHYMVLFVAQAMICILATATVISRAVVQHIVTARGLALAIAASGPALTGTFLAPLLNDYVDVNGWRDGYMLCAAVSAVFGAIALLLIPPDRKDAAKPAQRPGRARDDYPEIFRNSAFWILGIALLLCNFPQVIALTQLNLILEENHATTQQISWLIAAFAMGTLAGRLICGVALDRFPAYLVSAISMALPVVGLFLLASPIDTFTALAISVLLIGLAFGAEGDLIAYLVVRIFGVRIYSSVYGLMTAIVSASSATGALLVGITLGYTNSYTLFLTICGVTALIGSLMFLLLRNKAAAGSEESVPPGKAAPSPSAPTASQ